MPLTCGESELRERARQRIQDGRLPAVRVLRAWGGKGNGDRCSLCEQPIAPDDVLYEVEVLTHGSTRGYQFHLKCHDAWQRECTGAERAPTAKVR